jgi:hypothetical protein
MKRALYLLLLISSVCTAKVFAAEPAAGNRLAEPAFIPTQHIFTLKGERYATFLDEPALMASSSWNTENPPPISIKRAVDVARQELGKLVKTASNWKVRSITVLPANSPHEDKWYYVVNLGQPQNGAADRGDSVTILVDFSGKPGQVMLEDDVPFFVSKNHGRQAKKPQ